MAKQKSNGDYFSSDGNHVEPKYKECPDCDGRGHFHISECCGADIDDDTKICHNCKEHSDFDRCETCDGDGQVEMTYEEICQEEDFAKDAEADLQED